MVVRWRWLILGGEGAWRARIGRGRPRLVFIHHFPYVLLLLRQFHSQLINLLDQQHPISNIPSLVCSCYVPFSEQHFRL